jgi:uncharacterized protein YegL
MRKQINATNMSAINHFRKFYFTFQKELLHSDIIPVPSNTNPFHFGHINIYTTNYAVLSLEQDLVFVIDISGSMLELGKQQNTKISQLKLTLLNMIKHFYNNPNIFITLITFHSEVATLLQRTRITNENIEEITAKIKNIEPNGLTNIGNALSYTKKIMEDYYYPTKKTMIFMTDGVATTGEIRPYLLTKLINSSIKNIFIGYGEEHDGDLLESFTNIPDTHYYFIDKTEKCGLVYGEIIYDIMHILFEKCILSVENCLIYDYKKNSWGTTLYIGDLIGDTNKHYHIITNESENWNAYLHCGSTTEIFQIHQLYDNQEINFDKYIYRQRVLQLLYRVSEYHKKKTTLLHHFFSPQCPLGDFRYGEKKLGTAKADVYPPSGGIDTYCASSMRNGVKTILKEELKQLQKELLEYMQENPNDELLERLKNDLEISYHSMDKYTTRLYSSARFTSQGEERSVNVDYNTTENTFNASPAKMNVMHQISSSQANYVIEIYDIQDYEDV